MKILRHLVDPIIRRRAALHAVPLDRYSIRVARRAEEYAAAFSLLRSAYVWQGYESVRAGPMRITPQHVLPEAVVLVAYDGDRLVGTMTVTLDSPAGLPIEKLYGPEVAVYRSRGARLVEYGSLAIVQRCWHSGLVLLLYMAAYQIAFRQLGATHCIIEVAPKAVSLYRALFDFACLGPAKQHHELNLQVAALIHDMETVQRFVRRHYRKPMQTGHLPIEHFLGKPPSCIEMPPPMAAEQFMRWRMPREVFQEMFVRRSDRLSTLEPDTQRYLEKVRSRDTLNFPQAAVLPWCRAGS